MQMVADITAPRLSVWSALTDPETLTKWCCDAAEVELRPGGPYRLFGPHHPAALLSGGETNGKIRGYEPGATFQWDWPLDAGASDVLFALEDIRDVDQTRLSVRHSAPPLPNGVAWSDLWYIQLWGLVDFLEREMEPLRIDFTLPVRERLVRFIEIAAPPATVWRHITDPGSVAHWLSGEVGLVGDAVGKQFDAGWRNAKGEPHGPGEIFTYEPDRKLTAAWRYEGDPGPSRVTWQIDPVAAPSAEPSPGSPIDIIKAQQADAASEDRTRLAIIHEGLPAEWDAASYGVGWQCCLLTLRALAEERELSVHPEAS